MAFLLVLVVLLIAYQLFLPGSVFREIRADIKRRRQSSRDVAERLAQLHNLTGQEREVLRVYVLERVYECLQNPQDAVVLRDLTNALFLNEDYPSALEAMDNLAKLEPPAAGSWFIRAICYDKLSRVVDAIEAYQKFLDMDNEQHANQDIEARHRKAALEKELKLDPKLRKK